MESVNPITVDQSTASTNLATDGESSLVSRGVTTMNRGVTAGADYVNKNATAFVGGYLGSLAGGAIALAAGAVGTPAIAIGVACGYVGSHVASYISPTLSDAAQTVVSLGNRILGTGAPQTTPEQ